MPTILVIDDTALAREAVGRLLEHEGYRTILATNGKEGWATLYEQTPDLILLDLMMPQLDGIGFLQLLRRSDRWGKIPVIVLTGYSDDPKLTQRARELQVQGLLSKSSAGVDELLSHVKQTVPLTH